MLVIVGTLPFKDIEVIAEKAIFKNGKLKIGNLNIFPSLGTGAMLASACIVCEALNLEPPYFITAGDIGDGIGSRRLYQYVAENILNFSPKVFSMHYIMPDIKRIKSILENIEGHKATIIADAGAMYAIKGAGISKKVHIFTPDAAEMAYLADPKATHPAYVQHILFELDYSEIVTLIKMAYEYGNIPEILLVKGPVDIVVEKGEVVEIIDEPSIPALEAIGGTGDTLTGILSALVYAGFDKVSACIKAAKINRIAGKLANPDVSTPISEIIVKIEDALKEVKICA